MKKVIQLYAYNPVKGEELQFSTREASFKFSYALDEVKFDVEVDLETGKTKILTVDGRKVED